VLGVSIAAWRVRHHDEILAFAALWSVLFLAPVINLVPLGNTPVAMHYLYLPSVGLALATVRTAQRVHMRLRGRGANTAARSCAIALGGVLGVWFVLERDSVRAWSDEVQLYSRTAHNYPMNVEARLNLASVFVERGQPHEAGEVLDETLRLAPANQTVVRAYFDMLSDIKPPGELLMFADRHAADLKTPELLYKRGQLLAQVQRDEDAFAFFREAFAQASDPNLRRSIGYRLIVALVHMHHTAEAAALIDRLLAEYPDHRELLDAKRILLAPEQ
jgi:tetratricopeptide (TPR) repeat protein